MTGPKLQPAVQLSEEQMHKLRAQEQAQNPPTNPTGPTRESLTRPEGYYASHPQVKEVQHG